MTAPATGPTLERFYPFACRAMADVLRCMRLERGFTVEAMDRAIDAPEGTWTQFEAGELSPRWSSIVKTADYWGVTPGTIALYCQQRSRSWIRAEDARLGRGR